MTRYLFKVCLQIFLVVSMSFSFSYFLGESFDDNLVSAINFGDYVDGVSSGGGIDELMDSLGGGVGTCKLSLDGKKCQEYFFYF